MKKSASNGRSFAAVQPVSPAERKKIADLLGRIDPEKPESVLKFGAAVQSQIAQFQDRVMSHVQAKDNRRVIELLDKLLGQLVALEMTASGKPSIARKLRALRSRLSWTEQCLADYHELGQAVERQVDELNDSRTQLLSDVGIFEKLYGQNIGHLRSVSLRLLVLDNKASYLREKVLPKLKKKAEIYDDPLFALQLQDLTDQIDRLERRMRDLKLTREICVQSAGQIRLAQYDRQTLAERILDTVLNAVPLWKTQISIALVQSRQQETVKLHQRIMQATKRVVERNHALLKTGRVEAMHSARSALSAARLGPLSIEPDLRSRPSSDTGGDAIDETGRSKASVEPMKPAGGLEH